MINFDLQTPVAGPAVRAGANNSLALVTKTIILSMGKPFSGGEDSTTRVTVVNQAQKAFDVLDIAMQIHWGPQHARNQRLLEDVSEVREQTPAVEGEEVEVEDFDLLANGELWSVLFSVTAGAARELVQDCRADGRRALLRLRFEYRAGETARSVRELEGVLSRAKLEDSVSPHEQLRDLVQAHRALKKTQPYRDDDMLQRSILRALDIHSYHTLHMILESRVDSGISTSALIHEIEQYYVSYVSKGTTAVAAAVGPSVDRPCGVCGDLTHWIRSCPIVLRAKDIFQEEARVAAQAAEAATEAVAGAARGADFWEDALLEDYCADGTQL